MDISLRTLNTYLINLGFFQKELQLDSFNSQSSHIHRGQAFNLLQSIWFSLYRNLNACHEAKTGTAARVVHQGDGRDKCGKRKCPPSWQYGAESHEMLVLIAAALNSHSTLSFLHCPNAVWLSQRLTPVLLQFVRSPRHLCRSLGAPSERCQRCSRW